MNNHYFTDNRHMSENRKEISFRFWCFTLSLTSDNGVFSKDAVDFGTRVLLNTLYEHQASLGHQLLDVGCGYGPIGITLKKAFPEKDVTMIDVNPRAVELATYNAKQNEVDANILVSDVYQEITGNTFTDIITNPPIRAGKKVIYRIFQEAYDYLANQGTLWVVIRKAQGALSAKDFITSIYGNCEVIHKEKGYFILKAQKNIDNLTNC